MLELVRASSSSALACLNECLMITAKLPSGYQRDLQRLKSPVFRAIDLAIDSVDIMAYLVSGVIFLPDNIVLGEELHAAEAANKLMVAEDILFREAYRRIADRYSD